MGRWQPDARGRLAQAAIELYGERGYDATAVALTQDIHIYIHVQGDPYQRY